MNFQMVLMLLLLIFKITHTRDEFPFHWKGFVVTL